MAESKKHPHSKDRPFPEDEDRSDLASERRGRASHYSRRYAERSTVPNDDERGFAEEGFPLSFTKGLPHNKFGLLINETDYEQFKKEINQQDATDFETLRRGIASSRPALTQRIPEPGGKPGTGKCIDWRGWESPRAGHYFDLQGPDADAVGMPPAPDFESEELMAEMAEVYALALLRDVPFSDISACHGKDENTGIKTADVLGAMAGLAWFSETGSSFLSLLTLQEQRRWAARRIDHGKELPINSPPDDKPFNKELAFRGSGPGAKEGPFISQFMLIGTNPKPDKNGKVSTTESRIEYGTQLIDQRVRTFKAHQDYMLHWNATVDVQNGADFTDDNALLDEMRFIATPRDLAAYVRFDALYQAYLNACLIMLGSGKAFSTQESVAHPHSKKLGPGFPDGAILDSRQAFASFGGPHVLSLVTEVATRCLKAVRRQKFNYHRRARPERIGELLTLYGAREFVESASGDNDLDLLGMKTRSILRKMEKVENLGPLLALVERHNDVRVKNADPHLDFKNCSDAPWFENAKNRLLPMAFAEGSPMHPSYGAGHATVAGGCVTMLKAFFHTVKKDGNNCPVAVEWPEARPVVQASRDGTMLEPPNSSENMTINGELNKLAANISIGRNMAGVHFYTDYYESLRMGERVATGILIEQMKQYNEPVEMNFESFDGDHVHILKVDHDYADPRVFVHDASGNEVPFDDWWNRHLVASDTDTSPGDEGGEKSVDETIRHAAAAATGDRKPEAEDATGRG